MDVDQPSSTIDPPQVTDGQHTVQTTLEVLVSDINDNAPRFSQASYQAVVPGNAGVGVSVLTVRATDADDGANRAVTYSLRADVTLPSFAVDPGNGQWWRGWGTR